MSLPSADARLRWLESVVLSGCAPDGARVPRVSIVVNTLDRAPYLRRLLASFAHLDYPEFEVVVVNGPSTDGTEAVLDEFAGRIKVVRCPEGNLSRSRNLGIMAAAGEIVVFIDDDALPGRREWLAALVAGLAVDPRAAGVGGSVLHRDTGEYEFDGGATSDYGLQAFTQRELAGLRVPLDGHRWARRVPGGNCAFRRAVLVDLGGFDETFTYYLDETDLCLRAARAGHDIQHDRIGFIRHYNAPGLRRGTRGPDWRAIARSDTYYALKNGADPLPRRLVETLRLAPRKHFFAHVKRHARERHRGLARWFLYVGWAAGVAAGLWRGCFARRQTPLGPATSPPFVRFPRAEPARRLRVGLLSRATQDDLATYTHELAHGLHALGHEVHVFTERRERLCHEGLNLFVHGVMPEVLPVLSGLPLTDRALRWSLAATERVQALAADGVHLDLIECPARSEAAAVRRTRSVPVVVRLDVPSERAGDPTVMARDREASAHLERWLIAAADAVSDSPHVTADRVAAFYLSVLDQVGDRYRPAPRADPQGVYDLADTERVQLAGPWEIRHGKTGRRYGVSGVPGSSVELTVPAGCGLSVRFLGHPWAGVVSMSGARRRAYRDLYRPDPEEVHWELEPHERGEWRCRLALEAEANPLARGRALWLGEISLVPPRCS